jgi:hypothetical protein
MLDPLLRTARRISGSPRFKRRGRESSTPPERSPHSTSWRLSPRNHNGDNHFVQPPPSFHWARPLCSLVLCVSDLHIHSGMELRWAGRERGGGRVESVRFHKRLSGWNHFARVGFGRKASVGRRVGERLRRLQRLAAPKAGSWILRSSLSGSDEARALKFSTSAGVPGRGSVRARARLMSGRMGCGIEVLLSFVAVLCTIIFLNGTVFTLASSAQHGRLQEPRRNSGRGCSGRGHRAFQRSEWLDCRADEHCEQHCPRPGLRCVPQPSPQVTH